MDERLKGVGVRGGGKGCLGPTGWAVMAAITVSGEEGGGTAWGLPEQRFSVTHTVPKVIDFPR